MDSLTTQPQIANQDDNLFVARTILEQLGGATFLRMTGCKELLGCAGNTKENPNPWLRMRLAPEVTGGRQRLLITLMPNDLYEMDFYTPRVINDEYEIKEDLLHFSHVYGDSLQAVFTRATGFDTKL